MVDEKFDVVILGTGPAGLQAAIHAARAKVSVLVMGRKVKSSLYKAHVENYCCLSRVSGEQLLSEGIQQAEESGAQFLDQDVLGISVVEDGLLIVTESDRNIKTHSIILAMGVTRNRLGVPGEKDFIGNGVSYCVDCDANFFRGQKVAVVGNESAAVSGALTLLFYTDEVNLVATGLDVTESLAQQVMASDVRVHLDRRVKKIEGDDTVQGIILDDGSRIEVSGVFIETGAKGAVQLAAALGVALDEERFRFVVTDKMQQTNVPGIYAAGDICGPPWQMAKAVGEGCVAGIEAAKYAKKRRVSGS